MSRSALIAEYQPQATRLQDFYRRVQITGTSTKTAWPALGGTEIVKLVFKGNGSCLRVDQLVVETHRDPPLRWEEFVTVANPMGGFDASKSRGQSMFVRRQSCTHGGDHDYKVRLHYPIASAAYQFRELTILEFLKLPELKITNCEEFTRDGEAVVKVSYHYPGTVPGSFLFSKDKHWALIENANGTDNFSERLIIHDDMVDGMPRTKRIESWREYGDEDELLHEIIEVEQFEAIPAPDEDFTLTSVGLSDSE